jgi:poly-gamma-glutamate synthesis protein (capsule biosynthesis protein)
MRFKKLMIVLGVVLVLLLVFATFATFTNQGNETKENVSIAITGDVMFARNMAGVLDVNSSPFNGVSNVTSNVDLLIINFENAATTSNNAVKGDVPLKCDPSFVPLAKANNRTIAALANNHVCDYGIGGMNDTIKNLEDNGIVTIGAGNNESDAHNGTTQTINGRKITVINYMDSNNFKEYSYDVLPYANGSAPGYSAYDLEDAKKQIAEARGNGSELVIIYLHFGNEYSTSPNDDQVKIAHDLIDAGADVVIGAHPHVPQGIEMYKGKPICYSMGNFIFDQSNPETHIGYFVTIELVNDTGVLTVYPVNIIGYLPYFMSPDDGKAFLEGLNPQCSNLDITNEGTGKLVFNLTKEK